ncbi:Uncharacterised protein [Mycobacteroides abscessus subsp. bolletii]|nr:Uncharacterised protein [Mycobacteroides abscessus subsp. bolletii]SKW32373.1 Uncharacterised protein [Mycobacteroides abscessus subsp. abscessus]SIG42184.1 Uncharacterised protein [Mycobacteroides abscessus subsp. bolletii]SKF76783.1 Uncharacterised protein [Mycobacteroides abscessus subsp. bolletii]SKK66448.1 Uncharacterised protein [Mycobacteroides abscessus subsp. bolletii]
MPEVDQARMNSRAVTYSAKLRRECRPTRAKVNAATAPSAPDNPAKMPNWMAHLVGVKVSSSNPMAVLPMRRHTGPLARPGSTPRRSSTARVPKRQSSRMNTAIRRVSEPSTLDSTVRK